MSAKIIPLSAEYTATLTVYMHKKFPLYSINFDSLFYQNNGKNIENLIHSIINNIDNISEINLSSCLLDNKSVINILSNFHSLKKTLTKINLTYNLLTEDIFDLLIDDKIKS